MEYTIKFIYKNDRNEFKIDKKQLTDAEKELKKEANKIKKVKKYLDSIQYMTITGVYNYDSG